MLDGVLMENFKNNNIAVDRWIPLPLDYLLDEYALTSSRVLYLLGLWIAIISLSLISVMWISPSEFMLIDSGGNSINLFFLFYPPMILGTLLLFWIGFEWGFIPLFLSGFIITFTASVTYYWGLLFGIAFVLGLGIYALAYYCVPFDTSLRDFKSFVFFTVVSFLAAIASSLGSFVWSDFFGLSSFQTIMLWKGWWTGMFLQSMLVVAPLLYLFTPKIASLKEKLFPGAPEPKVTMGWIYSAIASVAVVLLIFIISAKILGTEGLSQQVAMLDSAVGERLMQSNESLRIISWISIGLVLVLGSGSTYLVGSWNKNLQRQVNQKTNQLKKSQDKLKEALGDRDLLLNALHDRVRNNLTMVQALLELQLKGKDSKSNEDLLKDSHARIRSMALIHETMVEAEAIEEVNFRNYVVKLSNRLQKSFQSEDQNIEVSLNLEEVFIHIDQAVPIALILNELMVNAFMHGFTDLEKGVIFVNLERKSENVLLRVQDNGHPLPPDFDDITSQTLGYKLIKTLVKQLQGEYNIADRKNPAIEIKVPIEMLDVQHT